MPQPDSIEKIRLAGADRALSRIYSANDQQKGKFRKAAEEAPFMIRTMGLGSGIASLAAKEGERRELAALLARWLLRECPHLDQWRSDPVPAENDHPAWVKALLGKIAASDRQAYRRGQIEALGYAVWLKRLSQAFCPKPEGQ